MSATVAVVKVDQERESWYHVWASILEENEARLESFSISLCPLFAAGCWLFTVRCW